MDRDVLVVGEALVDIVKAPDGTSTEYAGGSAANVAVALSRLGRPVRFATSFADDARGKLVSEFLSRDGVVLATDPAAVERTSTAEATIGNDGAATLRVRLRLAAQPAPSGRRDPARRAHLLAGRRDRARCRQRVRDGQRPARRRDDQLRRERAAGRHRHRPRGGRPRRADGGDQRPGEGVRRGPGRALPGPRPRGGRPRAAHPRAGCGRGDQGRRRCDVGRGRAPPSRPSRCRVDVADTIGAGDTFGAAIVDALWERGRLGADRRDALRDLPAEEIAEVLAHAARAAAVTVSRPGADPPYRSEL